MKKTLLTLLSCLIISILVFSGCTQPLKYDPSITSSMAVTGDALKYSEYIYFANAFKPYTDLQKGDNNVGNVKNEALYRVKLVNGEIETDEETLLPKNVELVISKIAGSECSFMYSIGKYIYFASPNAHQDIDAATKFELTTYFRVQTDGTGLSEMYTTKNQISKQTVLKIDNKFYLIFQDGKSIIKIELGDGIRYSATALVSDILDVVFAEKYTSENDRFIYYTTELSEENKNLGRSGNCLYKVDIVSGVSSQITSVFDRTITPIAVIDGSFYFKMDESDTKNYYYSYESGSFSTRTKISQPIDLFEIKQFLAMRADSNNKTYYIYAVSTDNIKKTYCLQKGNIDFSSENLLIEGEVKILFTHGDYVYYCSEGENENKGIFRISIIDKEIQTIYDKENFKSANISFDGKYIYFYAQTESNTTGIYYMHRAPIRNAEIGLPCSAELLGVLDDEDIPKDEESDETEQNQGE
ncbi:MAG: DUF5050 domain-containing protein [Clostridia bacterium]|nr:DUF5050 domain-containing protein [Clostridia bacterium]